MASPKPKRLLGKEYEKIWGSTQLAPWFPNTSHKTGEVWFADEASPVLIKFLFTTENLSVQVHPDDTQAQEDGCLRGKTEMWHILRAEPDACIALGLKQKLTPVELRQAALDGSIMDLLHWIPVTPGDTWFIPAGAIHAIGAGIALCEIQQHSDVTYRLYDYGRPRELHLDRGVAVSDTAFQAQAIHPPGAPQPVTELVNCPYFQVELLRVNGPLHLPLTLERRHALVSLNGAGSIAGEPFRMGQVWEPPPELSKIEIAGEAQLLHVAS